MLIYLVLRLDFRWLLPARPHPLAPFPAPQLLWGHEEAPNAQDGGIWGGGQTLPAPPGSQGCPMGRIQPIQRGQGMDA